MSDSTVDPTLDRLLRHMAWANATMFGWLGKLSDEDLGLSAPRNEWSVAMILVHIVDSAGGYASRLEGVPRQTKLETPTRIGDLAELAAQCAAFDARLRAQAAFPDGPCPSPNPANPPRARSTLIAQMIHHATEHRAQIAGALSAHGIDAIDLDELDLWAYGDAEGLGA
jgi:uncharacterized damage-inducible protein DinB